MQHSSLLTLLLALSAAGALRLRRESDDLNSTSLAEFALNYERDVDGASSFACTSTDSPRDPHPMGARWVVNCKGTMCRPATTVQEEWVNILPETRTLKHAPKLAVLVLTIQNMTAPWAWLSWLRNAEKSGIPISFIIHMKDASEPFGNPELQRYVLTESRRGRYCKVIDPEWLLMTTALQDPDVTHLAMVSGDSIPVKPMSYIQRQLEQQPATRMCMAWGRGPVFKGSGPRAETWFVMHRADAELFCMNQSLVNTHFRDGRRGMFACEEETTWMYPLVLRSFRWGMEMLPLLDECTMWTDWGENCKDWSNHANLGNLQKVRAAAHSNATWGHPRLYFNLTLPGLMQLRQSSFWFARKFSESAAILGYLKWERFFAEEN